MSLRSKALPVCLNPVASTQHDVALTETDYVAVWSYFAPYVRGLVVRALKTTSLHASETCAGRLPETRRYLAGVEAVRRGLLSDPQLVDDVTQDVALLFLLHVRAGRVRASACFVRVWCWNAVRWQVRGAARDAAMLAFASGTDDPDDDEGDSPFGDAHTTPGDRYDPEVAALAEDIRRLIGKLSPAKTLVVEARLRGMDNAEVARTTGLNENTVRVLLHRAMSDLRRDANGGDAA